MIGWISRHIAVFIKNKTVVKVAIRIFHKVLFRVLLVRFYANKDKLSLFDFLESKAIVLYF